MGSYHYASTQCLIIRGPWLIFLFCLNFFFILLLKLYPCFVTMAQDFPIIFSLSNVNSSRLNSRYAWEIFQTGKKWIKSRAYNLLSRLNYKILQFLCLIWQKKRQIMIFTENSHKESRNQSFKHKTNILKYIYQIKEF